MLKPEVRINDRLLGKKEQENLATLEGDKVIFLLSNAVGSKLEITFFVPIVDIQFFWHPAADGRVALRNDWDSPLECRINQSMPVLCLFNQNNQHRFSLAADDLLSKINLRVGVHEESASVKISLELIIPIEEYKLTLSLSTEKNDWSKVIQKQVKWLYDSLEIVPRAIPETALKPVLSTWYIFHQQVTSENVLREVKNYKEFGMGNLILDDGWQTDDGNRRYAYAGDWEVSPNKFPDFSRHIREIQDLGFSYMIWLSLPFLGIKTDHWERFKNKILYLDEFQRAGVLDIGDEQVRKHLIITVKNLLDKFPLDGLKLDFIETFTSEEKDSYDLSKGLIDFLESLNDSYPQNKDFLIEYRQDYVNPVMMQYCNIVRAKDCPNNYFLNRIRTVDLRLSCPYTAIHSDMIMWHPNESVESAALQLLNILFSVPQVSVAFDQMSKEHKQMLSFWLNFYEENKETLFSKEFIPLFPQEGYPQIQVKGKNNTIIFNYSEERIVKPSKNHKKIYVINGTLNSKAIMALEAGSYQMKTKDCQGNSVEEKILKVRDNHLTIIEVPKSGLLELVME